ncbi:hypothetical protein KQH62_03435 [bacterium]|nr:hypothetical protein [bacterium]
MDSDEKNKPLERCPALGFKGDPITSIGEPSSWNFCHKVNPIAIPNYAQQSAICLTSEYTECPIYNYRESREMPKGLQYQQKIPIWQKYSKHWWVVGILAIPIIVWLVMSNFSAAQSSVSPEEQQMTSDAALLLTLIARPTETLSALPVSPTPTSTTVLATQTVTPSPTETPATPTYAPVRATNTPRSPSGGNNPAPTSVPPTQAPPPTSIPPTQPPAPTDPIRPTP